MDATPALNNDNELTEDQVDAKTLQFILTVMPVGVILLNKHGVVYEVNPAAYHLLGEPLLNEYWPDIIQRKFHARSDDGYEISLITGERVNVATHPLGAQGGQLITLTDLTETRSLQESLSRYQRLSEIGRMSAAIAHQIRTPLSSALLYAGNLINKNISEIKKYEFCKKINSQLKVLKNQVDNMLLFAHGGNQCVEEFAVPALIDEVLDSYQGKFILCVDIIKNAAKAVILGNSRTLASAIINLIENAEQAFIAGNNHILLSAELAADYVMIKVVDDGPGMSEQEQKKALEPFFTTKPQGTGLGLAVAQAVLHAHQGQLSLQSCQGEGTVVSLLIPVLEIKGVVR